MQKEKLPDKLLQATNTKCNLRGVAMQKERQSAGWNRDIQYVSTDCRQLTERDSISQPFPPRLFSKKALAIKTYIFLAHMSNSL